MLSSSKLALLTAICGLALVLSALIEPASGQFTCAQFSGNGCSGDSAQTCASENGGDCGSCACFGMELGCGCGFIMGEGCLCLTDCGFPCG